jgi:hypothetical protein
MLNQTNPDPACPDERAVHRAEPHPFLTDERVRV